MQITMKALATIAILCAFAIGKSEAQQAKLDAAARERAIAGALRCLNEGYIYPEVAKKMEEAVRARAARREYDALEDGDALAERLTRDLRAVSNDLHIAVHYSAEVLPPEPKQPMLAPPPAFMEQWRREMARENFGVAKVEILRGNIGYLQFTYFAPPEFAADTYIGIMNTVAHTDALILDLRACNGSVSPDAIPLLCSYFFAQPTHLNSIYWRHEDSTRQFWTQAHVPGKRYLEKPIYVLTSGKTFSGAEELAYDLKNLKRATLIGDTTGGGANPGGSRRADDHFSVFVPFGKVINPITKTNWEGTGVAPDIAVPASRALYTAQLAALKQVRETTADAGWKETLNGVIAEVEQAAPKLKKAVFTLKGYPDAKTVTVAGTFNFWAARSNPLTRRGDAWVGEIEAEAGRHEYKFIVDGKWLADPANPTRSGPHANSVRVLE